MKPRRPNCRRSPGRLRKHGAKFKLAQPTRPPDRSETCSLGALTVGLSAWHGLHLHALAALSGMALRVEFRRPAGPLQYKRPMWLFWTGPLTVSLPDVCRMYLWRFAIEHLFRFLKPHLGLNTNRSTHPTRIRLWMRLCALAYWQLLLMRHAGADLRPAWHPRPTPENPQPLTPGQVQRGALRFLLKVGTPAVAVRPAGKGTGRPRGHQPEPRPRHPVLRKTPKRASTTT